MHYVEGVGEDSGWAWYIIESHLISSHVGFHGRNYILHGMIVVSVRPLHVYLGKTSLCKGSFYWVWLTLYGKNISCARKTSVDDAHPRP